MDVTGRRRRRAFAPQYKSEVVALYRTTDRTIEQIARELDLTPSAVRRWVQAAAVDGGQRPGLTTDERAELAYLRKENRILREERES